MPIQKITTGILDTASVFSSPTISGNLSLDSTGTTGVRVPSANTLAFHTAGTEDMRIDSSGNIGVGTTTLTNKFNVAGAIQSSATLAAIAANTVVMSQESGFARLAAFGPDASTPGVLDLTVISTNGGVQKGVRIDSAGRVTKAYQPAFDAYSTVGGYGVTTEVAIPFDNTTFNIGSHYNTSNYRFTAPVAGRYFFRAHVYKQSSGNASRLRLYKNGSDARVYQYISASDVYTHQVTGIISLAAGDYVTCTFNSDGAGTSIYLADNHSNFSGYLLG